MPLPGQALASMSSPPGLSHLALAQALSSHLQRPIWGGSPAPAASDGLQAQGKGSEVVRSNTSRAGVGLGQRGRGSEETRVPGVSAQAGRGEGRWAGRGPSQGTHACPVIITPQLPMADLFCAKCQASILQLEA